MGERGTIEGTVENVVFQNEENGYTVLSLLTEQGELVTVVGCIPFAAAGEGMTVTGVWVNLRRAADRRAGGAPHAP